LKTKLWRTPASGDPAIAITASTELLEPLAALCERATLTILSHYHSDQQVAQDAKADKSPVTAADLESHAIIVDGLADFGLPVLSEEAPPTQAERQSWQQFWMVDPLDGTREFLEGTGEFTINIALIDGHRASFGMIAIPLSGEVFAGGPGLGAWHRKGGAWQAVQCRRVQPGQTLVVTSSRRHRGQKLEQCLSQLRDYAGEVDRRHAGSALKFCELAAGRADFYPRFAPCSEWDTAAGQALLEGAGGAIVDLAGEPLRYNQRDSLLNPDFLAFADPACPVWAHIR